VNEQLPNSAESTTEVALAADAAAGVDVAAVPASPGAALRRAVLGQNILVAFLSIVLALFIGAILIAVTSQTVLHAGSIPNALKASWTVVSQAYTALFQGSVFDLGALQTGGWAAVFYPLSETLTQATPLALAGLAVAVPFRAGLFNIGVQGQIIMGSIVAAGIGFAWHLPGLLLLVAAVIGGAIGAAMWAGLAGWLKAKTGAHEVITTIMLNYIALYFLQWLLTTTAYQRPGRNDPISPQVKDNALFPTLFSNANLRVHAGLFVAIAAAIFVWWVFKYTTFGFRLRTAGANSAAARTAGINVGRTWLYAMLLGGVMAGLAASTTLLGTEKSLTAGIAGSLGFDAITVALLGRASPLGTVLAALLFGGLRAGGIEMQAQTGVPVDIVLVLQAVIVLLIAAPPLVRSIFRLKLAGSDSMQMSKGWNG